VDGERRVGGGARRQARVLDGGGAGARDVAPAKEAYQGLLGAAGGGSPVTSLRAAAAVAALFLYISGGERVVPSSGAPRARPPHAGSSRPGCSKTTAKNMTTDFKAVGEIVIEQQGVRVRKDFAEQAV